MKRVMRIDLVSYLIYGRSHRCLVCSTGSIAMMESQIESLKGTVAALKNKKSKKDVKKDKKREKHQPPTAGSSSKANGKAPKSPGKKIKKRLIADDDVLSFDQKKELSETISALDGPKLEKVIAIIHEGVPEIRDVCVFVITIDLALIICTEY